MDLLTKLRNIVDKILQFWKIGSEETKAKSFLTSSGLMKELKELFIDGLNNESLGERMLYPMSFHVLMHTNDYNKKKQAFPFILPEIIKAFYKIIDEYKKVYPNYEPVSKKWVFQFTPCYQSNSFDTGDGDIIRIEEGTVKPTAILYNQDIDRTGKVSVDQNIMVSVKSDNSNVIKTTNINLRALVGINILDEGLYTCKFDMNLPSSTEVIKESIDATDNKLNSTSTKKELATLSYTYNGQNYTYIMKDSPIYISGKHDTRTALPIFRMEYSDLENGHVSIKHENGEFFLCAFGKTRLNGRNIELSEGDNIKWVSLADNSSILMNDVRQANFKKK